MRTVHRAAGREEKEIFALILEKRYRRQIERDGKLEWLV